MIGHIGINVPDLQTAKSYYDVFMPLLGFEEFFSTEDEFSYRPAGGKPGAYLFIYPASEPGDYSRHRAGLQHVAFMVSSRSVVEKVHERVTELGATVLHEPRVFPEYPQPYYATFWLDPFGIMLEAVCHHDRD
ncbi:VOC family protein [Nonomuraea zeae]|uniref:Extradiol dioxygenase n=1 Tax=Nonomuraea zeae TaxID=1642303 RepID=A0A5S4H3Q7_9ACTN|nr:VOC family protein [Nonomuraea zeae]TMR39883.1 extradiol dioxygenase [Nonomuraea zeae]